MKLTCHFESAIGRTGASLLEVKSCQTLSAVLDGLDSEFVPDKLTGTNAQK